VPVEKYGISLNLSQTTLTSDRPEAHIVALFAFSGSEHNQSLFRRCDGGWKQWEGHVVDGRFPLRQHLGGSAHGAVSLRNMAGKRRRSSCAGRFGCGASLDVETGAGCTVVAPRVALHFSIRDLSAWRRNYLYVVRERSEEDLSQVIPLRPLTAAEARDMLTAILEPVAYLHAEASCMVA